MMTFAIQFYEQILIAQNYTDCLATLSSIDGGDDDDSGGGDVNVDDI